MIFSRQALFFAVGGLLMCSVISVAFDANRGTETTHGIGSQIPSILPETGNSMMFTDSEIRNAAVAFEPLVLFKIVSKEEIGQGTRSARTHYKLNVLATSQVKKEAKEVAWRWGHGWPTDGIHLTLLGRGSFSEAQIFPDDSEKVAMERFREIDSKLNEYKSKFMQHDAYVLSRKGKGEIVFLNVTPQPHGVSKKRFKVDVIKNLSGGRAGEFYVSGLGDNTPNDRGLYFALMEKTLWGRKVSRMRKVSAEESESLCDLYESRISFLKLNWVEIYAEP